MTLATAALALTAVGTGVGVYGQIKQSQALTRAENLRKKQMDLDVTRRKRDIVRQATLARSTAVANATASGSGQGSGLAGGIAGISAAAGNQTVAANQGQEIGAGIFDANAAATRYGTVASIGGGMQSLGGQIVNAYPTLQRIGWVT